MALSTGLNLRDAFGSRTIDDVFQQWKPMRLSDEDLALVFAPPADFCRWAVGAPRYRFDGSPRSDDDLVPGVSFMQRQIHRHWSTLHYVNRALRPDSVFVDLGSYPFGVPLALRGFSGFRGAIHASVVQPLDEHSTGALNSLGIDIMRVNLDPHVVDPTTDGLSPQIPLDDASADVVLMAHVLEHLYHPMNVLREIARILRPGGTAIITTDNGHGVQTIANVLGGAPFVHETVNTTAAMVMHAWRGHVRFFTGADVSIMMEAAGMRDVIVEYDHLFYNAFAPTLFARPIPAPPQWEFELAAMHPQFRNDMAVIARKS